MTGFELQWNMVESQGEKCRFVVITSSAYKDNMAVVSKS